jgi:hypothetical protein
MAKGPAAKRRAQQKVAPKKVAPRPQPPKKPPEVKNVPAKTPGTAVTAGGAINYARYARRGMEGTTAESFAVPFLIVLQKGSPQVDEASNEQIEGAKAGMFFETVSARMHDGEEGIYFVPCAYRRVFLRWGARGTDNSGFKGEYTPEAINDMRNNNTIKEGDRGRLYIPLPDGTINEKKCDRIADTRNHYGLLVDGETGTFQRILMSLASTQIKKSRNLMSALDSARIEVPVLDDDGKPVLDDDGNETTQAVEGPTFAHMVHLTNIPESNDLGSWHGVDFEIMEGEVNDPAMFAAAAAFNESVTKGMVVAKYDDLAHDAENDGAGGEEGKKGF